MQRIYYRSLFFVVSFLLLLVAFPEFLKAQGDLLITPRRAVFEGNKQSQEFTLANTGNDTAKYNVSFVQYRMTETGSFEQITEPDSGQYFADKYLRVFPRSVTLAPNESQVVRMQFRKMPDMKPGEYRSHLYFRAVPNEKPLGEDASKDTASIGIRLIPIFGITIPIIARVGDLNVTTQLTDLSLDIKSDTVPNLAITFTRSGDKSVFGDLIVNWISPSGESMEVGIVRGIAVYTPNSIRRFNMKLKNLPDVNYNTGKLIVRYQAPNEQKSEVFAEKELKL
ncbi:MAG: molecular chaperone [Chloroflexota bacterium]